MLRGLQWGHASACEGRRAQRLSHSNQVAQGLEDAGANAVHFHKFSRFPESTGLLSVSNDGSSAGLPDIRQFLQCIDISLIDIKSVTGGSPIPRRQWE